MPSGTPKDFPNISWLSIRWFLMPLGYFLALFWSPLDLERVSNPWIKFAGQSGYQIKRRQFEKASNNQYRQICNFYSDDPHQICQNKVQTRRFPNLSCFVCSVGIIVLILQNHCFWGFGVGRNQFKTVPETKTKHRVARILGSPGGMRGASGEGTI